VYDIRRRATLIFAVAAAVAACVAVVPGARAAPARPAGGAQRLATGNPWGQAREVPGTGALNKAGYAQITSVSCASAGNCSAGGFYSDRHGQYSPTSQPFVVSEVRGRWRKAEEVPGTAALNIGEYAQVTSVSCASAGNCSAGGYYKASGVEAFVVSEVRGRWRQAEEVPGTAALNIGGPAQITSVSCASAGNCSAGGYYATGYNATGEFTRQAFVVSEVHGTWQQAEEVPGTAALNIGEFAQITSVSCASAGNCGAGGYYKIGYGEYGPIRQAFVVSEVNGTWQQAEEVPGTAALNTEESAGITSVSCASAGNCSAGGYYDVHHARGGEAFVVSEVHGTWRTAQEAPGTAALNTGGSAQITSVSCASAGSCSAGGWYSKGTGSFSSQAFVVSEVHGTWRKAEEVPGTAALNKGRYAVILSVSCASAGNCSAGGYYRQHVSPVDVYQAFVVSEVHGTWRKAEEVPGTAALNKGGYAVIASVSCAPARHCSAGGSYRAKPARSEAFVVSRN